MTARMGAPSPEGGRSPFPEGKRDCLALAAVCLASAAVFLALVLPAMPHGPVLGIGQDEWHNMARGLRALHERLDPAYFIHPALYYEALAGLYGLHRAVLAWTEALGGGTYLDYFVGHEAQLLDLARYASAAFGALSASAAAWLGFELGGWAAAGVAGLLVAALPLHVSYGTFIRGDTLSLALFLVGAALIARRARSVTRVDLLAASVGIGLAAAANYPGALLLGLLAAVEPGGWRERLLSVGKAAGVAFGVFLLLNPYVLIDLPRFLAGFGFQAGAALSTHPHAGEPSVLRYLRVLLGQGWPCVAAAGAGLAVAVAGRGVGRACAVFGLAYLVLFSFLKTQYDRFMLPGLALLVVAGAAEALRRLDAALEGRSRLARAAPAAVLCAAMLVTAVARSRTQDPRRRVGESDYRAEMLGWMLSHLPSHATLVLESDTLPLLQTTLSPGGAFSAGLREAFRRKYPQVPERVIKVQYIGGVVGYEPSLLEEEGGYFLVSTLNQSFLLAHRQEYPWATAFFLGLDRRGSVVHRTRGTQEALLLYKIVKQPGQRIPPNSL